MSWTGCAIGCLLIPHLPLACEIADRPGLAGLSVVVSTAGAPSVWDVSPAAEARGVHHGQSLRHAQTLCPALIVIDGRPAHYQGIFNEILDHLDAIVPSLEPQVLRHDGVVYMSLHGLDGLHTSPGDLARHLIASVPAAMHPRVGMAAQKFPSLVAATTAAPGEWVVTDAERTAAFLAPRSIRVLPASTAVIDHLLLLGLDTLGKLARLPCAKVTAELGREGTLLWRLAAGQDDEPVRGRRLDAQIHDEVPFDPPLSGRDQLFAALLQQLQRVTVPLQRSGRAARRLTVILTGERGDPWRRTVILKELTNDPRDLHLLLCRGPLAGITTAGEVSLLSLTLTDLCAVQGAQQTLAIDRRGRRGRLDTALTELRARYGRSHILSIVSQESWSPFPEDHFAVVDQES